MGDYTEKAPNGFDAIESVAGAMFLDNFSLHELLLLGFSSLDIRESILVTRNASVGFDGSL